MPHKNKDYPLVSIVVLNYNSKEVVERCLKSVLNSNYPHFEVIFVDNASTDGGFEFAKALFGSETCIRFILNSDNFGFAEGNNIGARETRGKYVIFLNNDTEVEKEWLNAIVSIMEADPTIGACQSKIRKMDNPEILETAGGVLDYCGFPHGRGLSEYDNGQFDRVEEIFASKAVSMTVRRSVLKEVGLFDPKFFIYCDEADLCWRIRLRGYKVVFVPKSIVYHKGQGTTRKQASSFLTFHATKNHFAVLIKNYGAKNLLKYLLSLFFIRVGEITMLLLMKRSTLALAKINAMFWVLRELKYIWRLRIGVQLYVRRVSDDYIMLHMQKTSLTRLYREFLHLHQMKSSNNLIEPATSSNPTSDATLT